ncbi:MAG: bifunctional chorismate-binding protein/class IV aminotransferase [Ramlibacter sp.]
MPHAPFALLDDDGAGAHRRTSRLYLDFVREHRCTDPALLDAVLAAAQADMAAGLHALVLIDYEWGARLQGVGAACGDGGAAPALRLLLFSDMRRLARDEADRWLAAAEASEQPAPAGVLHWREGIDEAAFAGAIARIHDAIRAGESYQVNFTYALHGEAFGAPLALYRRLRAAQPVPYGALIALPAGGDGVDYVLSCSPELFLRHEDGVLTARPMKGTAPRSGDAQQDRQAAERLRTDAKSRAENVMIVDLLRNDLGRIACLGSVQVPQLFVVEAHPTVLQMTSLVSARLRPDLSFADVLRASFPCGSITGAPKLKTMALIAALENRPRGLYTGAIGWLDAPGDAASCGNFVLSVAIRTLTLGPERQDGTRAARLGVGAGIVMDSVAREELAECRLKARFATALAPGFALLETMRAEAGGVPLLERHLDRLARSAAALGFACDRRALRRAIARACSALGPGTHRLRLQLQHDGALDIARAPLAALPEAAVTLVLARTPAPGPAALARHKTTHRAGYDAAVRQAEAAGAFDALFFNAHGRLTEGGRSNVFVRLDGRWVTPPVSDGVLPGVMRARLLEDPAWAAVERSVSRHELQRAEAIVVCNALRGPLPARLLAGSDQRHEAPTGPAGA